MKKCLTGPKYCLSNKSLVLKDCGGLGMLVGWQTIVFRTIYSTGNPSIGSSQEVDQGKISMMFTLKMLWNRIGLRLII